MSFCLPQDAADKFIKALKSDEIDPQKLSKMSPEERTEYFSKIVGDDASSLNQAFEEKWEAPNRQAAMIQWAKESAGIKPELRDELVQDIKDGKLPPDQLARKAMGARPSRTQIKDIMDKSKAVMEARDEMVDTAVDSPERIQYGNDLQDLDEYVNSLKPPPSGTRYWIDQILNTPKSALTSIFHFSAAFVQGWGRMTSAEFWDSFGQQFKYFLDPKAYRDDIAATISHPYYEIAKEGGFKLTNISDDLTQREEQIQGSLLQHVPYLKDLTEASSRGFTGFLNHLRAQSIYNLFDAARLRGEDISIGSKAAEDIVRQVMNTTGRGRLGKNDSWAGVQPELNAMFFSPRKISATIQMFNPMNYLDPRISKTAKIDALRQMSGSILATAAVLQLLRVAGAKVNLNPVSTNFLKAQFGKTTFDFTGSNSTYLRLLGRLAENQEITSSGKLDPFGTGFGQQTRADQLIDYARDKLSPVASIMADFLYGADPAGNPFNITNEMKNELTPIVMQNFINLYENDPNNTSAWMLSLAGIFGVDMESEAPYKK